ncbi:MAG: hypothetical protein IPI19_18485 [Ignavibacteriales bacterium]|nr:hypothetical protein [Ignavibacteriales bacterium]
MCKNGKIIDVLLSSTPLNLRDISGGVTFTALDITERKKTEIALKESQQMLQNILDKFPGVVLWKDINSTYLGCNLALQWSRIKNATMVKPILIYLGQNRSSKIQADITGNE